MHVFRDCPEVMQLLMNRVLRNVFVEFYRLELVDWMNLNINVKDDGRNG